MKDLQIIPRASNFITGFCMAVNELRFVAEFFHGCIQNIHPTLNVSACTSVNKRMAAIENKITHVNNICMFKMDHCITISMTCTKIMKGKFFLSCMLCPYCSESLVGVKLFVFNFLCNSNILLIDQRIFMSKYSCYNIFKSDIS